MSFTSSSTGDILQLHLALCTSENIAQHMSTGYKDWLGRSKRNGNTETMEPRRVMSGIWLSMIQTIKSDTCWQMINYKIGSAQMLRHGLHGSGLSSDSDLVIADL